MLPTPPCPQFCRASTLATKAGGGGGQTHSLPRRWWSTWGLHQGEGSGDGVRFPVQEAQADGSRAGPSQAGSERGTAGQAGRAGPAHRSSSSGLRASLAGGEEMPCPASCPLWLARSPAASTGNNRGPQRPPMQALLRGRPGREGGHCRPLFQFPQHCPGSKRPLGANKAPPTRSCPASPSPTLGTGPLGPGLL